MQAMVSFLFFLPGGQHSLKNQCFNSAELQKKSRELGKNTDRSSVIVVLVVVE